MMSEYYFTFRSVTAASRAERSMQELGIRASVVRTPSSLRKHGCGYSLRVSAQSFAVAKLHLSDYQRIYEKKNDLWHEVEL